MKRVIEREKYNYQDVSSGQGSYPFSLPPRASFRDEQGEERWELVFARVRLKPRPVLELYFRMIND